MRKLCAVLIAVALFAPLPQTASAKGAKSSPSLYKSTAKGEHYKEVTITSRKKSTGKVNHSDITIKKTTDKASP
jgi:type VI protein secretion system component Hcp